MKRTMGLEVLDCPRCHRRMELITAIASIQIDLDPAKTVNDDRKGRAVLGTRPAQVGLAHELIHASHIQKGNRIDRDVQGSVTYADPSGKTYNKKAPAEELRTIGLSNVKRGDITENQIRREQKVAPRLTPFRTVKGD
jgi:Effector protein